MVGTPAMSAESVPQNWIRIQEGLFYNSGSSSVVPVPADSATLEKWLAMQILGLPTSCAKSETGRQLCEFRQALQVTDTGESLRTAALRHCLGATLSFALTTICQGRKKNLAALMFDIYANLRLFPDCFRCIRSGSWLVLWSSSIRKNSVHLCWLVDFAIVLGYSFFQL